MQIGTILFLLIGTANLLVAVWAAWKADRAESGVTKLHVIVNSRLDQWMQQNAAAARAEGKLEGEQMGRQQVEDAQKRAEESI